MRFLSTLVLMSLLAVSAAAGEDRFTVENVTKSAAAVAGGKKQAMVLVLKKDDLRKGDFQRAIAFCRQKKIAMAIGGPDAELVHTVLRRELAATGKPQAQGALIIVVGPKTEDARLRPLLAGYGVEFIYAECMADGGKG